MILLYAIRMSYLLLLVVNFLWNEITCIWILYNINIIIINILIQTFYNPLQPFTTIYNHLQPFTTIFKNNLQSHIYFIFVMCVILFVFLYLKYIKKIVFNYLLHIAWLGSSIKWMFVCVCVCVYVCVCVCVCVCLYVCMCV